MSRALSKANFRDHDGRVRDVTAFGKPRRRQSAGCSRSSRTEPRPTSPANSPRCTRSTTSSTSGRSASKA